MAFVGVVIVTVDTAAAGGAVTVMVAVPLLPFRRRLP
jgi:hypothetical protein